MKNKFHILSFVLLFTNFVFAQKNELNPSIYKYSIKDSNTVIESPLVTIEFKDGTSKTGELVEVDDAEKNVKLGNSSDTTSIDFENVYNVRNPNFNDNTGFLYSIDAPERFFYTPMGNTMQKGMFALENYLFANTQVKASPIEGLEMGIGITVWQRDEQDDTTVATYFMGSLKYRVLNRRHLKIAVGAETIQMPPPLLSATGQNPTRAPWFNIAYISANWEYRYMTFSFSTAQGYLNSQPIRQTTSIFNSDRRASQIISASASFKIFPWIHLISENLYFAGASNVLGNQNTIDKVNLFMPLVGGRYYGEYYSFAAGVSNIVIPNSIFFFYVGGSYYFK